MGKTQVVYLTPGDDLRKSIKDYINKKQVQQASVQVDEVQKYKKYKKYKKYNSTKIQKMQRCKKCKKHN